MRIYTASLRQLELDNTFQEFICPELSISFRCGSVTCPKVWLYSVSRRCKSSLTVGFSAVPPQQWFVILWIYPNNTCSSVLRASETARRTRFALSFSVPARASCQRLHKSNLCWPKRNILRFFSVPPQFRYRAALLQHTPFFLHTRWLNFLGLIRRMCPCHNCFYCLAQLR